MSRRFAEECLVGELAVGVGLLFFVAGDFLGEAFERGGGVELLFIGELHGRLRRGAGARAFRQRREEVNAGGKGEATDARVVGAGGGRNFRVALLLHPRVYR